ncbi:MAG TPA: transcription termination/antitermination protein NusG [Rhizobiaceae bacterium]|nr:transcription termination/antitermination protein NusG [Rhizobiaceae bacterium]
MRINPKRWRSADIVGPTDRQTLKLMAARELSRRQQALLAAVAEPLPERCWYVLTVFDGCDNLVDIALDDVKIEHWMPSKGKRPVRRRSRFNGRRDEIDIPAFPGYMFVHVFSCAEGWQGLKSIEGVRGVIGGYERPAPVKSEVITRLQVRLESDPQAIATLTNAIQIGDKVDVVDGPFASFPGVVESVDKKRARAKVEVLIFGRIVSADLELAQIEKSA